MKFLPDLSEIRFFKIWALPSVKRIRVFSKKEIRLAYLSYLDNPKSEMSATFETNLPSKGRTKFFFPQGSKVLGGFVLFCAFVIPASANTIGKLTYSDDGTTITIQKCATDAVDVVVIPAKIESMPVVAINADAFSGCTLITEVTIPEGVTNIGDRAFINCVSLARVSIPDNVTAIGVSAFYGCKLLTSISLPIGVTVVSDSLFGGCRGLIDVSFLGDVTSIGNSAFETCASLTALAIPSTVTSIGSNAFIYCAGLTSITIPAGVTILQSKTFNSCSALTAVTLPTGITSLAASCFADCSSLVNISIPTSVQSIGNYAFVHCTSLLSIIVPEGMTTIGTSTFEGCELLSSVGIPSTLLSFAAKAFYNCKSLDSVIIPASVSSITSNSFGGCDSLLAISVASENTNYSSVGGVLFNSAQDTLLTYPAGLAGDYVIPATVTAIGASAFIYAKGLTSVKIPTSVTNIGSYAFYGCNLLTSAEFLGNAPSTFGSSVFMNAEMNFKVLFHQKATGFTTPTWKNYPSEMISSGSDPIGDWLTSHSLPTDSDLTSDANHDGVSLLMAYALNLNPAQNLSASLPQVSVSGGQMSLTFYAGAAGVTYEVVASPSVTGWSTEAVTLSDPDANQMRTATTPMTGTSRFMRLVVHH